MLSWQQGQTPDFAVFLGSLRNVRDWPRRGQRTPIRRSTRFAAQAPQITAPQQNPVAKRKIQHLSRLTTWLIWSATNKTMPSTGMVTAKKTEKLTLRALHETVWKRSDVILSPGHREIAEINNETVTHI